MNHLLNFDQDSCFHNINQADYFIPYIVKFLHIFRVISKWDRRGLSSREPCYTEVLELWGCYLAVHSEHHKMNMLDYSHSFMPLAKYEFELSEVDEFWLRHISNYTFRSIENWCFHRQTEWRKSKGFKQWSAYCPWKGCFEWVTFTWL